MSISQRITEAEFDSLVVGFTPEEFDATRGGCTRSIEDAREERWIPALLKTALDDNDTDPKFREFVAAEAIEAAEQVAGYTAVYTLGRLLDVTGSNSFRARVREAWTEHLEAIEQEDRDRHDAFWHASPMRAFRAAMSPTVKRTAAIAAVETWLSDEKPILLLHGIPGAGKTLSLCYHAYAVAKLARPPAYITAVGYSRLSRFDDTRAPYLEAPYLIFDEVGGEYDARGLVATDVDELLNEFYTTPNRRLLLSSNLPMRKLVERYGVRVADRLREAAHVVAIPGPSMRRGK